MNVLRLTALVLCVSAALAGCGKQEPVRLGFVSGQTGPFSDLGSAGLNGAILAVEQRNASGGVSARPIKLLIRDDEHNSERAKTAFQELVQEDVTAIVGPMTSAMATELVPLAERSRVVLMGGTVVTKVLSGKDDFFLRAIAPTSHYAAYSAEVHVQQLKPGRVTVVFDVANRDYAGNWAQDYAEALKKIGGVGAQIVELDSRTQQDLAGLSAKFASNAPDLIVFACSARTAGGLMRAIRSQNADVRFAASAWAANHLLTELAGPAAEGALIEQYHDLSDKSDRYARFTGEYRQRFNLAPDYAAVIAYDATNIVLDALDQNPRREKLKETLLQKRSFNGLQVGITLDANGDASRKAFTTVVKHGQFSALDEPRKSP